MGIYDREYYRDETSGSGWFSGLAPACRAIIVANVALFLAQWIAPEWGLDRLLMARSDDIFRSGRVWELLTAAFYHKDALHILFNMVVLWSFGREIEPMYGSREFLRMYLTAAVLSTFVWAGLDSLSPDDGVTNVMLGASGAVFAVFTIYALYYPRREVLVMFILPVQIGILLPILLGMDLYMLLQGSPRSPGQAGTAFASHLAGAAYGFLYKRYDLRWSRLWAGRTFRPKLRVVRPEPRPKPPARSSVEVPDRSMPSPTGVSKPSPNVLFSEAQLDERLDEILAKIARDGRGTLSEEENRILQEASQRAKNRRGGSGPL